LVVQLAQSAEAGHGLIAHQCHLSPRLFSRAPRRRRERGLLLAQTWGQGASIQERSPFRENRGEGGFPQAPARRGRKGCAAAGDGASRVEEGHKMRWAAV